MAATFDTPVLVTEVGDERFRVFQGTTPPPGLILKVPRTLHGFYQITGPLHLYHRLSPPESDVTREEFLHWLETAREIGCEVKVGDFPFDCLRR